MGGLLRFLAFHNISKMCIATLFTIILFFFSDGCITANLKILKFSDKHMATHFPVLYFSDGLIATHFSISQFFSNGHIAAHFEFFSIFFQWPHCCAFSIFLILFHGRIAAHFAFLSIFFLMGTLLRIFKFCLFFSNGHIAVHF